MYGSICQCVDSWRWFISDVWEHMSVCSQLEVVHIRCMEAYVSVQLVGGGSYQMYGSICQCITSWRWFYQMYGSICQCVASWRWFISDVWKHTSVCSQLEVVLHIRCVGAYVSVQLVGGGSSYQMCGSICQCVASWRWFISDVWKHTSVCSQLEVVLHIRCMGVYVSVQLVGGGSYQMHGSICQCVASWRWFISDAWKHMSVCNQLEVVHIRCMGAYVSVQLVGGGSYQMYGSICQCVACWRWFISDVWKHMSVCSQLEVVLHIRCMGVYVSVQLVGGGSYQMHGSICQCVASWRWFISDAWKHMSVCSQLEVVHIRCMEAYVSVQLVGGGSYQMYGSICQCVASWRWFISDVWEHMSVCSQLEWFISDAWKHMSVCNQLEVVHIRCMEAYVSVQLVGGGSYQMYGSIRQCVASWRWFISDVWKHMSVCSQLEVVHIRCMEAYVSV